MKCFTASFGCNSVSNMFSLQISYPYPFPSDNLQGGRGHWGVYYTSPQSFNNNVFLFVGLTTLGTYIEFIELSV